MKAAVHEHKLGTSERPDLPLAVVIGCGGMGVVAARRLAQRHRILIADIDAARVEAAARGIAGRGGRRHVDRVRRDRW